MSGSICGVSSPCKKQIHVREQIGKRFGFATEEALGLEHLMVFSSLALFLQMIERCDQKSAGAAGRVEEGFAEARIGDGDHETDTARGV